MVGKKNQQVGIIAYKYSTETPWNVSEVNALFTSFDTQNSFTDPKLV